MSVPSGSSPVAPPGLAGLDALAATAWTLEPPQPHEMKGLMRDEAAFLLDGLLTRLARGRGALDVAIGEALDALGGGDRALRLGFSSVGDYARERLGIAGSTAEKLARLARELRERPRLRDAVRRGEVSARKAETILPVARGEDEAAWTARARVETVRALDAAVKAAAGEPGRGEPWERISIQLTPERRACLDEALALAGRVLGETAPRWQRLEAICAEFLGAHPVEPAGGSGARGFLSGPVEEWLEGAKEWLEQETARWDFLGTPEPVPAPEAGLDGKPDPWALDAELRRLATMRDRWDEVFGHVAMLLRMCGLWRDMRFASFGHYCAERLGMAESTVSQRASLERRLWELPALRQAMREGRISYEKARLVARCADEASVEGWIERARRTPCIALRRELEAAEEDQMCARGDLDLRVPVRVASLLAEAIRAARATETRWLTPGECVERIARHFVDTWRGAVPRRRRREKVLAREGGFCQVPGCSRAATHAHHVLFRSLGGGDEPENLVGLCAAHHLHGVHLGWIRVRGRAPDRLRWQLGVRAGRPPLVEA